MKRYAFAFKVTLFALFSASLICTTAFFVWSVLISEATIYLKTVTSISALGGCYAVIKVLADLKW